MVLQKLCISQQESGMQYTHPTVNTWRKTNYIEAQRLQQKDMPQRHNKERQSTKIKQFHLENRPKIEKKTRHNESGAWATAQRMLKERGFGN